MDGAYGFSFGIALGLILFIAGLVVSLYLGGGSPIGLVYGIPLLIAGLVVPLIMMRDVFARHDVDGDCPECGVHITTSDSNVGLECPRCHKPLLIREAQFHKTEG
jgi:predicted RNA-binding Zn-ribbon protein involved in translation (DUF1610 family)